MPSKIITRRELKAVRASLTAEQVRAKSKAVCNFIRASELYQKAGCLMAYLAFGQEVCLDELLQDALAQGKTVAVPQVLSKTGMAAVRLTSLVNLVPDCYGIRSVAGQPQVVEPQALDLILVPGVGFSPSGQRIGMGAGYYDRFLVQTRGYRLGVTYEALLRKQLPVDELDQKVTALVTELGIRLCS
jgi:5-formyltetrahydrofolate cyclo-ligase